MSVKWPHPVVRSEDHIDLAHGFIDFPCAFGVRGEEERIAAGEMNRVFTVGGEAAVARQEMHHFCLLDRTAIRAGCAFEYAGIDGLAAWDDFVHAGDFDFLWAGK